MKRTPNLPRLRRLAIASSVIASLAVPLTAGAATVKSGASCARAGRTAKVGSRSYRCVRAGAKLKWALVGVKKAAPDTKAPDTKAPDTKAPDTKAPTTKAPDTKAP